MRDAVLYPFRTSVGRNVEPCCAMSYWTNFATSAAGPAIACIFTNPADVAKTRLSLERELQKTTMSRTTGSVDMMRKTYAAEGLAGLQRGLPLAMAREASKNTFRLGLYQPLVDLVHGKQGPAPLSVLLGASMMSGAISAMICNPFDLLKTRLQLDGTHARGTAAGGGAISMAAAIVREEGLAGLWRGTGISMVRSGVGAAALLPTNSKLKEIAARHMPAGPVSDGFCALGAGAANVAVINPVDVLRTRLYSQPLNAAGKGVLYDGALDAASKILQIEGAGAFYKGATAHFLRVGPHTVLTFVFIGLLRRTVGYRAAS